MTKKKNGQTIHVVILQKKTGNQHGTHTKIVMNVDLGFQTNLTVYESKYLENELRVAIRSALILQFGLRAEIIAPSVVEEEPEKEDLFSISTISATPIAGTLK